MKLTQWTPAQRQYCRNVKHQLRCPRALRKRILSELAQCIENEPGLTYAELEQRFGTPEQFAENVHVNMEPEQIVPHTLFFRRFALALAVVCLLMAVGFTVGTLRRKKQEAAPTRYAVLVIHPQDGTSETIQLP